MTGKRGKGRRDRIPVKEAPKTAHPYEAFAFTASPLAKKAMEAVQEYIKTHRVESWDIIMYPADSTSPTLGRLPLRSGDTISRGVGALAVDVFDPEVPPWAFMVLRPYVVELPFRTVNGGDEALVMYYSDVDDTKRNARSINPSFGAMMGEEDAAMLLLRGTVAVVIVKDGRPVDAVEGDIAKVTHYVCK